MLASPARRRAGTLAVAFAAAMLMAAPAYAGSPSPLPAPPSPSVSPSSSAEASATASPTPSASPSPTPMPTLSPTPTTSPAPTVEADRAAAAAAPTPGLTLRLTSSGGPAGGRFYEDLGRFAFAGAATGLAEGTRIEIFRRSAGARWSRVATTSLTAARYATSLPVTGYGAVAFVATTGGAPGTGDEVASPQVGVSVRDAKITLDKPSATVDSMVNPALTGRLEPARAGVQVTVDVRQGSTFRYTAKGITNKAGRFRITFRHGRGNLAAYTVRANYRTPNRPRWERSGTRTLKRIAVLNAVVKPTTARDVAKTYRRGCPVGPSRLRTITMNFYGRDKKMHRGVLIIRTDLVPEVKRGFQKALDARFPLAKLDNPNAYGGNDPRQMAANNTSGFNCRKVVGNPYAQSPHSYGIAIDVTPVQNPYRDSRGKWWPSNGKSYIDRTPLRFGMLGSRSPLTRQLAADDFFWGGRWNPGRDYQHFEYRP